MRMCVVANRQAGSSQRGETLFAELALRKDVVLHLPETPGEARDLVAGAADDGFDMVVAAGGDGTIHTVVNALAGQFDRVRFGVIPLGTGNDFSRTLAIPDDPLQALTLLTEGTEQALDLIGVEAGTRVEYCVNMAAGGYAGQMQSALPDLKKQWGPLGYLMGAFTTLPDLTEYDTRIAFDESPSERMTIINLIAGNGRTAAGGHRLAPLANPQDGLLDVIILEYVPLVNLAGLALQYVVGNFLEHEQVRFRRARRLRVTSKPPMMFELDGELFSDEPLTFTVEPGVLRTIVGPEYVADIDQAAKP